MEFFTDRNCGKDFPRRLRDGGVVVHMHDDYFEQDVDDEVWAPAVAARGWIGISRDRAILRITTEYDAVMFSGGRLLVLTGGNMKTDLLASNFLNTLPGIERFVQENPAPFIAMVYRPSPIERIGDGAPGEVRLRMNVALWEGRRRARFPGR